MKNPIDDLIDSGKGYAHAYMMQEHGYGHMIVKIRLGRQQWGSNSSGSVKVSCQIGGEGAGQCSKPYAIRYGFDTDGQSSLAELEIGVKLMRKITRYMNDVNAKVGHSATYAEECQRILDGSGVKQIIVKSGEGWAASGRMADSDLIDVGTESRIKLVAMEAALIKRFAK